MRHCRARISKARSVMAGGVATNVGANTVLRLCALILFTSACWETLEGGEMCFNCRAIRSNVVELGCVTNSTKFKSLP